MGRRSPFPLSPLFFDVELFYSGGWNSLAADLNQSGASLAHGARSEGSTADASELTFTLRNGDGKYSPRNPVSPLYGLVGRNTPVRARVKMGAPWIDLEPPLAFAATPNTPGIGTNADLDVRWWGYRDSWTVAADLMSKYLTTNDQRSWIWRAEADGTLTLFWSQDGISLLEARSEIALPAWAGEIALRFILDVNNGAGGRTIRFEYATDIEGPWVQLGPEIIQTGTTSVFNSTASLYLGKTPTSSAGAPPQRVYGYEFRNVIGSVNAVSSVIASDLTPGTTTFRDAENNRTWTTFSGSVSNAHTVAMCEVAEWPMEWNTKGGESVLAEIQAAGVTRRLGQGEEAVESVLYRAVSAVLDEGVKAYWPMEDGTDATSFGPSIGTQPMGMSAAVDPGAYDDFRGSAPIATLNAGRTRGVVDFYQNTGVAQVRWVQWIPGGALTGEPTIMRIEFLLGTIGWIDLKIRASDGAPGIFGYTPDGVELAGSTFVGGVSAIGKSLRMSVEINQAGSKVFWRWSFLQAFEETGFTHGQEFTFDHTIGRVGAVTLNPQFASLGGTSIGHVTVGDEITPLYDGVQADILTGHFGEEADTRLKRLAGENGTAMTVRGHATAAMGEQQEETLLDLFAEAAAADGGLLHDDMSSIGLRYRTLYSLGDQPAVVIPYDDNRVIPFRPSDDDALTRNRVTVTRPNGSRITHEVTEGPMSTQTPANGGVGLYDESLTLNLADDETVDRTARWLVHVGTWDEGRYPALGVDLANPYFLANPELTRKLLALTPGDRLVVEDPPPWLPPFAADVIVRGVQVVVETHHVRLTWSCVSARPYRFAYWNAGHRWSGKGTELSAALTTTATTLSLSVPDDLTWTHVDGDYDILVGGEQMTVTDVWGDGVHLVVTRSVNGVVKSHSIGAAIELAEPSFYAR